ncbi:hypothetical protein COB47_2066 [Caldicellulosiruptor obsidiansis OB47]|jgi:uncharacterized protein YwgA|uniref:Antitoxin SocA-like Panacea domain-containing protein n=1 Tax=Caldicellulosiruptor obsidiansis (strain ATCC BAA-2073 / JCM 16842 / OB47) TaxID=608506 RepID=D9TGK5_CALOO|nr:hypothetical protein [Caldicellulosiruptor obsidiansis]ADL43325.1 hypothetical protein COB47_2066 [Caldicellulosiruptor obsidiansis OB47]
MKENRDLILWHLIKEFTKHCSSTGNKVGKKFLQKVVYLLQRKGLNLNYNFSIHYYGPYSSQLEYDIHRLEMNRLVRIDPKDGYTHEIIPEEVSDDEKYLSHHDIEMIDSKEIKDLIKNLSSFNASELELIATVDYVINQLKIRGTDELNKKEIIEKVKKLKGNKYTEKKIEEAIKFLEENGFVKIEG